MTTSQQTPPQRHKSDVPIKYSRENGFHISYKDRNYHNQFFHLYSKRLNDLRPRVFKAANKKWDHKKINDVQVYHCDKVLDIRNNEPCWVIGLTYCEMQYKPNILDDVAIGAYGVPPASKPSYSDPDSDLYMLEDESGRVSLDGDLMRKSIFVTGNVIGVLGIEVEAGQFRVLDVIYPGIAEQVPRPLSAKSRGNKVALISGLEIDPEDFNPLRMEILKEFLLGEVGGAGNSDDYTVDYASKISRLIIAGNSTRTITMTHENDGAKYYGTKAKSRYNPQAMKILDSFIDELLSSISVDIMPGETDPAGAVIPQQPIHSAFFKNSKKYLSSSTPHVNFRSLTNPTWLEIDDARILGTSGQNISDMLKYVIPYYRLRSSEESATPSDDGINGDKKSHHWTVAEDVQVRSDLVEATIQWQNIIPSCPDTLWTYPFEKDDPFTLTETPHVYFVANQPEYTSKVLKLTACDSDKEIAVTLVTVPKFSETGEIVLLDTVTLETEIVKIC